MDVERRKDGCPIEHVGHDDVSDERIFEGGRGLKPNRQ